MFFYRFLVDFHRVPQIKIRCFHGEPGQADRATLNLSMGTTALVISASQVPGILGGCDHGASNYLC